MNKNTILNIENAAVKYGNIIAVDDISIKLKEGEVVSIIGPNGAGKTSLLNGIMGVVESKGNYYLDNKNISNEEIERKVELGLCLVPETRELFYGMSVSDNLDLGGFYHKNDKNLTNNENKEWVLNLFPRLRERLDQLAGTMSGGEQQMLALGRALMSRPRVLMLDEPSLGLAPLIVNEIFQSINDFKSRGISLIVVEQNALLAMKNSNYCYVIEGGKIVLEGNSEILFNDPKIKNIYLGLNN